MAQNITIQGLPKIDNLKTLSLNTPIPIQKANVEYFNSVTMEDVKAQIYATCDTAAGTSAKIAKLSNFGYVDLFQGITITVIFTYENTADNVTLQLQDPDGNTISGNINVYALNSNMLQLGAGAWKANARIFLEFDGYYFQAHTTIVKQTSTYTMYNDGRTVYEPISTADTSSPAAVNSSALSGALAGLNNTKITTITDCNDAIPTLFYSANYFIRSTGSNAPTQGRYFIVSKTESYGSDTITSTRIVFQNAYCCDPNVEPKLAHYIRRALSTDSGSSWTWTDWERVTTASVLNGALADYEKRKNFSGNLNALVSNGFFLVVDYGSSSNLPESNYGAVKVWSYSGWIVQEWTSVVENKIYRRTSTDSGSTWTSWKRLSFA